MEVRSIPNDAGYARMTTAELRRSFVFDNLFIRDTVSLVYCSTDRAIVGGIVPVAAPLELRAERKEMAAAHFTERREAGIVNIGAEGTVRVGDDLFRLGTRDILYAGKGNRTLEFASTNPDKPAVFYLVSYPAHAAFPTTVMRPADAQANRLGTPQEANQRCIAKYIHGDRVRSCQLVMGITQLDEGSVWNTMPAHTHQRRSEIYLYFDLDPDAIVVHLMGRPEETRSLILRNRQAVLAPEWSVHTAAATRNYAFIWAMGGENQEFSDMDAVSMRELS